MKWLGRLARLVAFLLKASVYLVFYGTPVLGVWLASSLTAYLDGPTWAAALAGLLVFPILPLLWEARSEYKRRRREDHDPEAERILTLADRLSLRTFALGLVFVGALLWQFPRNSFVALSTRGDWMLDQVEDPRAEPVRQGLFHLADGLEWLYQLSRENPYESYVETQVDRLQDLLPRAGDNPHWPWPDAQLHPAVTSIPASSEGSLEEVARYLARHEKDPYLLVKALHDYAADRIAYDAQALWTLDFPPQDAATVFARKDGVCIGYANLLAAMGKAIGVEVAVVVGDTRDQLDRRAAVGHAWNAVRIEGRWYLMDATWDAGTVSKPEGFEKRYSTQYLLTPPEAFAYDHLPEDPKWQLLDTPLSQGDFLRQPRLRPAFRAQGLELISPTRSQTEAGAEAELLIKNPRGLWIMAAATLDGEAEGDATKPSNAGTVHLRVPLPGRGLHRVQIYTSPVQVATYRGVGSLDFVN